VQAPGSKVDLFLKIGIAALAVVLCVVVAGTLTQHVTVAGDTAPKFKITTDQGRTISRSDFGGDVLVLNFWASWCPPCIQEMPSLDQFARQFQNKGVTVLAISVDTNERKYRDLLNRAKPAFLTARDPAADIAASYGTFMFPETYIIDRKGKVLYKEAAARDWTDPAFLNYFQSLL
jgi:cytochrome c biogenesis protein CcmG/thiol:disulfide interchange protein DsbE